MYVYTFLYIKCILYMHIYPWVSARGCVELSTEGWRRCWKETENIPIGPLWYSGATMPAIGRRSTKPLNDPPWRSGATTTLFQSRKSSYLTPSHSRADSRCKITPFFDINDWPMYRRSRAYGNAIANYFSRFPYRDRFATAGHFDRIYGPPWTGTRDAILWNIYFALY